MNSRIYSLDILKTFCCIFVILQHLWFVCPWVNGQITSIISMSVPMFFMISGYLNSFETPITKYGKRLNRIVKILLFSTAFYIGLYFVSDNMYHTSLIKIPTNIDDIWSFLKFNDMHSLGRGHLWYLAAYTYVIAFFALLTKLKCHILVKILPLLLLPHIIISLSSSNFHFYNNFLFNGIPCYAIGMLARNHCNNISTPLKYTLGGISLSMISLLIFGNFTPIITILCKWVYAISLFLCFTSFHLQQPNFLSKIGVNYSLYIYVFHMAVIDLLFCTEFSRRYFYHMSFVSPIIVFIITLFISFAYKYFYNKMQIIFTLHFNKML